jgi:hypothetical protein
MNTDRIRALNDAFRTTGLGGRFMLTAGVNAMKPGQFRAAVAAVKSFDKFEEANSPYQEHDFGAIDIAGVGKLFWKIDDYDTALEMGSDDPSDPAEITRVLTIMLTSEY